MSATMDSYLTILAVGMLGILAIVALAGAGVFG